MIICNENFDSRFSIITENNSYKKFNKVIEISLQILKLEI